MVFELTAPCVGIFLARKVLEVEMVAEEGKNFVVDAVVGTIPVGIAAPCTVKFFGFMDDAEFVELIGERLVGIDVVPDAVAAGPVDFESAEGLEIVGVFGDERFDEEVVAQTGHLCGVDDELAVDEMRGRIEIERRIGGVGQVRLKHAGEYGSEAVAVQVVERFCVSDGGPVGA